MNLKELAGQVELILKDSQKARDSDLALIYNLFTRFYDISISDTFRNVLLKIHLEKLPSFESISRCRRKLQENGAYPSSPEVARRRGQEANHIKGQIQMWGAR